jgi:hypothetical protein
MKSKKLLLLLLLLLLENCATQPPNVPILTRLNATQCFYVYTMSRASGIVDDENLLNGKTCHDYLIESLYLPVDSWKEIKSFILKMCKQKGCDGIDWKSSIDTIDSTLEQ